MEQFLKQYYDEEITNLLNDSNDAVHVSINVSLTSLKRHQPQLFTVLLTDTQAQLLLWNSALLQAQKQLLEGNAFLDPEYQIKENCHVRFVQLPIVDDSQSHRVFPNQDRVGQFVQVKGNVVRMTQAKLLECKRDYVCGKCKSEHLIEAEYTRMYVIEAPRGCTNPACRGTQYQKREHPAPEHCIDYQEIRIQELISDKNMPASLLVTLENDLVDSCQPGDCITVCGTVELRWRPLAPGKRSTVVLAFRAISVFLEEKRPVVARDLPEHLLCVRAEWQESVERLGELGVRDLMLQSFCPEVHGMYLVKLAIMLALCSGVNPNRTTGRVCETRGNSHLIMIGDPGLAKSRLLKFAAAIAVRSIHTTGMGCSAAGLTAAAVKEDGEWQLEAGALVLADGGVCCIDEFNLMRESDKASIHEAMEQQTISMAKAGLVCKLSTRCTVLAATNPKNLYAMYESEGMASINIGIASPLLSRFDIVLILRDERDPDWDNRVVDHILYNTKLTEGSSQATKKLFSVNKLQTHLMAVRDIHPTLSKEANLILGAYYRACRADPARDPARTTVRLLDSLVRLAQAHTRLMFRSEVSEKDAVLIVRLMESSWGFGKLLTPQNILKADLPIGPSMDQVEEVKRLLRLSYVSCETHDPVSADVVTSVARVNSAESDIFADNQNAEMEFSQTSLLTNQSFKSVMLNHCSGSSIGGTQTSRNDARSNIATNLNRLATVLSSQANTSSFTVSQEPPILQTQSSKTSSSTLFNQGAIDDIDAILSFDSLDESVSRINTEKLSTQVSKAEKEKQTQELASWVDFEVDDESKDATDDIPADIEMEFSQNFTANELSTKRHNSTSANNANEILPVDIELEFSQHFSRSEMDESKTNRILSASKDLIPADVEIEFSQDFGVTKPTSTSKTTHRSMPNENEADTVLIAQCELTKVTYMQESSTHALKELQNNSSPNSITILDELSLMGQATKNIETIRPRQVSNKTIDRLNKFQFSRAESNNVQEVEAIVHNVPVSTYNAPSDNKIPPKSHSDSAYESMTTSSANATAPTGRMRTSFLSQRHDEHDLDFLDELDV